MRIVIDMNLSPEWAEIFEESGHTAHHWMSGGSPGAKDPEILEWARTEKSVVFTNDLDFGRLLALTYARGPSVIQSGAESSYRRMPGRSSSRCWRSAKKSSRTAP